MTWPCCTPARRVEVDPAAVPPAGGEQAAAGLGNSGSSPMPRKRAKGWFNPFSRSALSPSSSRAGLVRHEHPPSETAVRSASSHPPLQYSAKRPTGTVQRGPGSTEPHVLPPFAQQETTPPTLSFGTLLFDALSDTLAFATAPLRWIVAVAGPAGGTTTAPAGSALPEPAATTGARAHAAPSRRSLNWRPHAPQPHDPNALPHAVDERVDVCYGETAEWVRLRARLREQLQAEGVYKDWLDNNHAIMRFMRARQFSYEKSLAMLRACLEWRVERNVDNFLATWTFHERKAVKRYYQYSHHRTDKLGRVVYIERVGRIDFAGLTKVTTFDRLLESFIYDAELTATRRLPAAGRAAGHAVDKIFTILDLDGFRLSMFDQNARDYLKAVSQMASDYYPEQLGQMFIVNAPVAFRVVWAFVKPLLDIKTQQKIRIFSTQERAHMSRELLSYVAAENLPTLYGGEDESCDFQTERGPWVDEEWERRFV